MPTIERRGSGRTEKRRRWREGTGRPLAAALRVAIASALSFGGAPVSAPARAQGSFEGREIWRELAPGLELARFAAREPAAPGDSALVVVRIDPRLWDLGLYCAAQDSAGESRTARRWAQAEGLSAAINAGMYATDYRSHVGYLRADGHRGGDVVPSYRSLAVFGPRDEASPAFRLHDLEEGGFDPQAWIERYRFVVQNLRLVRRPGVNVWQESERRWSEAALGEDAQGRALLIFCREALSMPELNRALLRRPIGLVAAQHLEGGPEAQLYLEAGGRRLELFGSYETGFREDDTSPAAWPVPNVIGVRPRPR